MATETVYTTGKSSSNARINIGSGAIATADGQIAFPDECSNIKLTGVSSHADGTGILLSIDNNGIIKKTAGTNITVAMIDQIAASAAVSATPTTLGTVYGQTMNNGNVILGSNAAAGLVSDATSEDNTAIGRESLFSVSAGTNANTAVGNFALYDLTTGNGNTAVGRNSATALTTGSNNTFIGQGTLTSVVDCTNSTALGVGANITASNQLALAFAIDHIKVEGLGSAADATGTLLAIDGSGIIRKTAGTSNTVALIESAIASAGASATTTARGTVYGNVGGDAGFGNSSTVVIGYGIAPAFQAGNSTVIGYQCGSQGFPDMTSSSGDTVIGSKAMSSYVSGSNNVAIGLGAGVTSQSGSNNTFVGATAGVSALALSGVVALGRNATAKADNECAIAPTVTQWRSEGLTTRTGGYGNPICIDSSGILKPCKPIHWNAIFSGTWTMTAASNTFTSGWNPNTTNAADYRVSGNTAFNIPTGYGGLWRFRVGLNTNDFTSPSNVSIQLYNLTTGAFVPNLRAYSYNMNNVYQHRPLGGDWYVVLAEGASIQPRFTYTGGVSGNVITYYSDTFFTATFIASEHV